MRIHETSGKTTREVSGAECRNETTEALRPTEKTSYENKIQENQFQRIAENAHNETKAGVLETYGSSIPESRREALDSPDTSERLKVLSASEYSNQFPESNPLVLGHCDSEGNIYIKAISENAVTHISTHETMHLCANREAGLNENGNWCIKSGLRETEFSPNRSMISDTGRGINEGATEMYTLRELERRGNKEAACEFTSYPQSREWAARLEQLIGEDHMAKAYFGGEKGALEKEFNRFAPGESNAWESFSRNIDIIEYSSDALEVQAAQRELAEQYFRMILEKDLRGDAEQ